MPNRPASKLRRFITAFVENVQRKHLTDVTLACLLGGPSRDTRLRMKTERTAASRASRARSCCAAVCCSRCFGAASTRVSEREGDHAPCLNAEWSRVEWRIGSTQAHTQHAPYPPICKHRRARMPSAAALLPTGSTVRAHDWQLCDLLSNVHEPRPRAHISRWAGPGVGMLAVRACIDSACQRSTSALASRVAGPQAKLHVRNSELGWPLTHRLAASAGLAGLIGGGIGRQVGETGCLGGQVCVRDGLDWPAHGARRRRVNERSWRRISLARLRTFDCVEIGGGRRGWAGATGRRNSVHFPRLGPLETRGPTGARGAVRVVLSGMANVPTDKLRPSRLTADCANSLC